MQVIGRGRLWRKQPRGGEKEEANLHWLLPTYPPVGFRERRGIEPTLRPPPCVTTRTAATAGATAAPLLEVRLPPVIWGSDGGSPKAPGAAAAQLPVNYLAHQADSLSARRAEKEDKARSPLRWACVSSG